MFEVKDLEHFNIIMANEYSVTVTSRNAGHYWYVRYAGVLGIWYVLFFISKNIASLNTSMVMVTVPGGFLGAFRNTICGK